MSRAGFLIFLSGLLLVSDDIRHHRSRLPVNMHSANQRRFTLLKSGERFQLRLYISKTVSKVAVQNCFP